MCAEKGLAASSNLAFVLHHLYPKRKTSVVFTCRKVVRLKQKDNTILTSKENLDNFRLTHLFIIYISKGE